MNKEVIGKWALILGLVVAVLAVFATGFLSTEYILLILFVIGLIIGFLNISQGETVNFLIATIALLAVSGSLSALAALNIAAVTDKLVEILSNFIALISAAALVVSIKVAVQTSKK